jgi:ABC-2 type transport system ATP-binding protein
MLQKGGVYPTMTPREAVRLFAQYYDESEEPDGMLFRVGLSSVASTPWRRLSGGEQQRLSLALALVGRPWVAFLDEPTAGVDPQGRLAIRDVISDLRSAGTCVLLTTHEMQEAERLADRIIILDHGRVVADGAPSELMTREGGKEIRFGAPAGLDTAALGAALAAVVTEDRPGEYLVRAEPKPSVIAALTAWLAERDLALADLRAGRERLEDVFLRLTSDAPETGKGIPPEAPAPAPASTSASTSASASASAEAEAEAGTGTGTVGRRRRVRAGGRGPGATDPSAPAEDRAGGGEP